MALVTRVQSRPVVAPLPVLTTGHGLPSGVGQTPGAVSSQLKSLLIDPIQSALTNALSRLKNAPGAKIAIANVVSKLKINRANVEAGLDQLRTVETQEGIASIGLAGFEVTLNLSGMQFDISSSSGKQEQFLKLVREYIFNYPVGAKWPPEFERDFTYFQFDSTQKQLCCVYWPLYGYVERIFLEGVGREINVSDLFKLNVMRSYCDDPFKRQKGNRNKGFGSRGRGNRGRGGGLLRGRIWSQRGAQFDFEASGDTEERNSAPPPRPPRPERQNRPNRGRNNRGRGRNRSFGNRPPREEKLGQKAVAAFAYNCNPKKLQGTINTLRSTQVTWNIAKSAIQTSEYDAMNSIVAHRIKKMTDQELIVNNQTPSQLFPEAAVIVEKTIQDLQKAVWFQPKGTPTPPPIMKVQNDAAGLKYGDLDVQDKGWVDYELAGTSVTFIPPSSSEPIIKDPFLGVIYTYGDLQKWFGSPRPVGKPRYEQTAGAKTKSQQKKQGQQKRQVTNPIQLLEYYISQFKKDYHLSSAMFRLDDSTLAGVRKRLLSFIGTIFTLLKNMYVEVEKETTRLTVANAKNTEDPKVKEFLDNINKKIALTTNNAERKRLQNIRARAKAKIGLNTPNNKTNKANNKTNNKTNN